MVLSNKTAKCGKRYISKALLWGNNLTHPPDMLPSLVHLPKGVFVFRESCYVWYMNSLMQLATKSIERRGLTLILTPNNARDAKTTLIAQLILKGPLFVLSGDEWVPGYALPRIIRSHTTDVKAVLSRLHTARVSTCFRLLSSLGHLPAEGEPILVMDFLHTFYDANIALQTRFMRLRDCCEELKRLASHRPVILTTWIGEGEGYDKFFPILSRIADRTFSWETEPESKEQPTLF